ncbi:TetR/AcrR family transcriptional regulator [Corynebacterium sp. S7]
MNKRELQGEQSRVEILDAALKLMSQKGFDGTSISDIARESGLPNSSIYWHFGSKLGVGAAATKVGADRFLSAMTAPESAPDETPGAYLQRALGEAGELFITQPEFLRLFILFALERKEEEFRTTINEIRGRARENLKEFIRQAWLHSAPEHCDLLADELVEFILAGFDGAFLSLELNGEEMHRKLMRQLAASVAVLGEEELQGLRG